MATTTSHRSASAVASRTSGDVQSTANSSNSNSIAAVLQHQPQQQQLTLHRPRGAVGTAASLLRHRRWGMCVATIVGLLLILYQVLEVYWWRGGYNIHDTEIDWERGRTVTRRRPELLTTIEQDKDGKTTVRTNTPIDGILEGHLTLIDITLPTASSVWSALSQSTASSSYTGIQATFCHVSWNRQQTKSGDNDDIKLYPTMLDLQKASILCPSTTLTVALADIVSRVRQYDANRAMFSLYTPPTAVIFHESKSGSTVVSNALTAFRPTETRVYSEAAALTKALLACSSSSGSSGSCNDNTAHQQLIRDVFYLLGRRGESSSQAVSAASITSATAPTRRVFYKLSSASVQAINAFVQAMPTTPWIYVYRDSVEVLMSHFAHYQQPNEEKVAVVAAAAAKTARPPECLQGFGATTITTSTSMAQPNTNTTLNHAATMDALARTADKSLADLTDIEYCAAYLAALCTAAVRQHNNTKDNIRPLDAAAVVGDGAATTTTGQLSNSGSSAAFAPRWFINYNQLPFVVWEMLLPQLLIGSAHIVTADEIQRMKRATRYHSHAAAGAAGPTKGKAATPAQPLWKEDVTLKQGQAPLSLQEAAQVFMDPVYAEMERIRTTMSSAGHG